MTGKEELFICYRITSVQTDWQVLAAAEAVRPEGLPEEEADR